MTDRELLEAAAKAAGIDFLADRPTTDCLMFLMPNGDAEAWNPLHDDGDALRLAVKCRTELIFSKHAVHAVQPYADIRCSENPTVVGETAAPRCAAFRCWETLPVVGKNPAPRGAIVRAAAALCPSPPG